MSETYCSFFAFVCKWIKKKQGKTTLPPFRCSATPISCCGQNNNTLSKTFNESRFQNSLEILASSKHFGITRFHENREKRLRRVWCPHALDGRHGAPMEKLRSFSSASRFFFLSFFLFLFFSHFAGWGAVGIGFYCVERIALCNIRVIFFFFSLNQRQATLRLLLKTWP